jgi:hypothetical protein
MKNRIKYAFLSIIIIALALKIRSLWRFLPYWLNFWIGDFLWAIMLYCIMIAVFLPRNRWQATRYLVVFCWIIEISQAWHTPWLDAYRNTYVGGLLLGHGFLWSDIIAYTAGVLTAYWVDKKLIIKYLKSKKSS